MKRTDMSAIWFTKIMALNCTIGTTPIGQMATLEELHRKKELCELAMVNCIRGRG